MRSYIYTALVALVASPVFAATVALTNVTDSLDGGWGIRDAAGTQVTSATDSSFKGAIGRFTITDSAVSSAFAAGNATDISNGFSGFGSTFSLNNVADGLFSTSQDANTQAPSPFGGSAVYVVLFKGASLATATELMIAKLTDTFPTDPTVGAPGSSSLTLKPTVVTSMLAGSASGTSIDYGFGSGPLSTFQMALVGAAPEPSRVLLAGLGLMGLVIRRRRK